MDTINYEQFSGLDIRIARINSAERVEGTDRLLKLEIDAGGETRVMIAGIAGAYKPEEIVGRKVPVLLNLEPRKIRGIESSGMILAADADGIPVLLGPDKDVQPGCRVK
jgi:methionine--tRNA ligase beta chain